MNRSADSCFDGSLLLALPQSRLVLGGVKLKRQIGNCLVETSFHDKLVRTEPRNNVVSVLYFIFVFNL